LVDLLEGVGLPVVCVVGEFDGAQDLYSLPACQSLRNDG
jgi:hypothetical protein